ncbi:MAG: PQQ-binding-like beta-propeller repeat protein, partial [Nanoarchaeota archaeon]
GHQKWVYQAVEDVGKVDLMFLDSDAVNSISGDPTLADIDGDGRMEVMVGTDLGVLYVLSSEGKLRWKYKGPGPLRGAVLAADIERDGKVELIFGSDRHVVCISAEGKELWSYDVQTDVLARPVWVASSSLIVLGTGDGGVHAFSAQGKKVWTFKATDKVSAEPIVAKDVDGKEYIIVGSMDNALYCLDLNGNLIWQHDATGSICSRTFVADIDKDGRPEIVFGACDNGVHAITMQGDKEWMFETDFWVVAPVQVLDIDDDGELEVVAASYDHHVYVLDGRGKYVLDHIPGLSGVVHQAGHYADVLTQEPGENTGNRIWMFDAQDIIVGSAILERSVVITTKSGKIMRIVHQG